MTQLSDSPVAPRQSGMLFSIPISWPTAFWCRGSFKLLDAELLLTVLFLHQRLAKWFTTLSPKDKAKIVKDVSQLVLSRRTRMCNFLEYKGRHTFFQHLPSYNTNRNYFEQIRR
jgi:hypothetical protein